MACATLRARSAVFSSTDKVMFMACTSTAFESTHIMCALILCQPAVAAGRTAQVHAAGCYGFYMPSVINLIGRDGRLLRNLPHGAEPSAIAVLRQALRRLRERDNATQCRTLEGSIPHDFGINAALHN